MIPKDYAHRKLKTMRNNSDTLVLENDKKQRVVRMNEKDYVNKFEELIQDSTGKVIYQAPENIKQVNILTLITLIY